jgi:hypothetical protein
MPLEEIVHMESCVFERPWISGRKMKNRFQTELFLSTDYLQRIDRVQFDLQRNFFIL